MSRAGLVLVGLLTACSAYDGDIGPTPYLCGETEPRCPEGYSCQDDITTGEQVCVGGGGSLSSDFDCADDSAIEPNNLLAESTDIGVDAMPTYSRDQLAICPANDKDLFTLDIATQTATIELVIEFQADGANLVGAILNAGGIPIASTAPVSGEPYKARAVVQNLPAGTYYAQVAADVGAALTLNNYRVSITVTGP